jgi:hypothetical protein
VLVNHWGLNQYADPCQQLLKNDLDYGVRDMAASCLGTLYRDTSNADILRLLKSVITDKNEHWTVRQAAYDAILRVLGMSMAKRPSMTRKMDFEHDIDWQLLDKIG